MNNNIKWLRLQELCATMVKERLSEDVVISIHASTTALPANIRSAVERNGAAVSIFINLSYNKNVTDVTDSIAHELTHVLLRSDCCSSKVFQSVWAEVRKELTKRYEGETL